MTPCMRSPLIVFGCAALIWAGVSPSSRSQPSDIPDKAGGTPTPTPLVDPVTGQAPNPEDGPRFDFSFDALPLSEVIQIVRKQFRTKSDHHLNVIVPDHLRSLTDTSMVTMEIKQVTVGDLFKILSLASKQEVRSPAGTMPALGGGFVARYETTKTGYAFEPVPLTGGHRAYLLTANLPPPEPEAPKPPGPSPSRVRPEPPSPPRSVQFFQLRPYLEANYRIEDIITAMKTGWELSEDPSQPTVKFHEETQLLVVAGQREHLQVVEQVLERLANNSRSAPIPRMPIPPIQGPVPRPVPVPSIPNPAPTP